MRNKYCIYYQPNKKQSSKGTSDCVIRALTKVMGKEWLEVFDDLTVIAREAQTMPNNKECYTKYLTDNNFKYTGISNKKGTKRPTVYSFAKEHKNGTYFVVVANHVVAVVDGAYYDTWDSGECCLYGYWEK